LYGDICSYGFWQRRSTRPHVAPAQAKRSTYIEVSSSLENEIRRGVYPPGSRLPPQRQLATDLGINVSTVSRAYKEGAVARAGDWKQETRLAGDRRSDAERRTRAGAEQCGDRPHREPSCDR
jgi:DNA-binding transcriptional MocR family regulator